MTGKHLKTSVVDTRILCAWLEVPPDIWPPDHYTLLGLEPGEKDIDRIEQHVQKRLETVRRYQLKNPEMATEAMNRLAQAFVCLTDPEARRAYNRNLFGEPLEESPEPAPVENNQPAEILEEALLPEAEIVLAELKKLELPPVPPPAIEDTHSHRSAHARTELMPAIDTGEEKDRPSVPSGQEAEPERVALPRVLLPEPELVPKIDPVVEAAQTSQSARRGLGTKRALYYRIARTRALLRVWKEVGKYFNDPKRRLNRPTEARELMEQLTAIRRLLTNFPPLLGEAGQPGYLVVSLARQQVIVPTFQTLLPSQRDALARDWNSGLRLLAAHQQFLRQELRAVRRKSLVGKLLRATRAFLNEHPAGMLVVLGLVALVIAIWRQYF